MLKRLLVKPSLGTLSFFLIASIVVAFDQMTKRLIEFYIPFGASRPEEGFFRLTHVYNTGAAFGILKDHRLLLCCFSVFGTLLILYIALVLRKRFPFLSWKTSLLALGLILGGTIGNMLDRVFIGHVTDFLKVWIWADFNIADSSLVTGNLLIAFNILRFSKERRPDEANRNTNS